MNGKLLGVLAALSVALFSLTSPTSAQDTTRIRGTIERIDGPVFVVKTREGAEVKLTVTDNPLFVAIVPGKISDIKPGMFVGSAGLMQALKRRSRCTSFRSRCAVPARDTTTGIFCPRAR
jgi:hypothetical protein